MAEGAGALTPWLSIVLPCWQDRDRVAQRIEAIQSSGELGSAAEYVVADATPGGDRPPEQEGVLWMGGLEPGRGGQLAAGAAASSAPILLFHHADNELGDEHLCSLRRNLRRPEVEAGAFHRDIAGTWPEASGFEGLCRWWSSRLGILYGDQSVWVRRSLYERIGGISRVRLMEDVEFSDRLRRTTSPVLLDPPIRASMRRFKRRGRLRNKLGNLALILRYRLGADPDRLYERYYRRGRAG